jgi:hypothetical protein
MNIENQSNHDVQSYRMRLVQTVTFFGAPPASTSGRVQQRMVEKTICEVNRTKKVIGLLRAYCVAHTTSAGARCTEHDSTMSLLLPAVPAHSRQCYIIDIAYHIVVDVNNSRAHMLRVPVTVLSRPRNMANMHVSYESAVSSHTGSRAAPYLTNIRICASRAEGVQVNGDIRQCHEPQYQVLYLK